MTVNVQNSASTVLSARHGETFGAEFRSFTGPRRFPRVARVLPNPPSTRAR